MKTNILLPFTLADGFTDIHFITGFCVHMKHPHKFIVTLLQILDLKDNKNTDVASEAIACACVHLSANRPEKNSKIPLTNPAWNEVFDASKERIEIYKTGVKANKRLTNKTKNLPKNRKNLSNWSHLYSLEIQERLVKLR
uniref:Uncharacterized protein n=1 Tax=Tetranychus urticae TaxID=32264 RepID=T1L488_TETUR